MASNKLPILNYMINSMLEKNPSVLRDDSVDNKIQIQNQKKVTHWF